MLPGMQGETVLESLRDAGDVPVLITSAKRSDADRIEGLRAGADDYLPKPFNPHSSCRSGCRRSCGGVQGTGGAAGTPPILSLAEGRLVDPGSRRYTLSDGASGRLTPGESALLGARLAARHGPQPPAAARCRGPAPRGGLRARGRRPVANLRRKLGDDAGGQARPSKRCRPAGIASWRGRMPTRDARAGEARWPCAWPCCWRPSWSSCCWRPAGSTEPPRGRWTSRSDHAMSSGWSSRSRSSRRQWRAARPAGRSSSRSARSAAMRAAWCASPTDREP